MKDFMDKDFMLETETAKHLFHDYAEDLPLIDYHCHMPPKEIYEDRHFNNIVEVWLGGKNPDGSYFGDHYKWRLMRANGVPEDYVTGDKPPYERFVKFAETLEMAIGNPMYHWCNMELKKYFGYDKPLTVENAGECWNFVNDKLQNDPNYTARGLMKMMNVEMVGTTDDPIDSLEWHKKLADDPTFDIKVCPSYRPDKALGIMKDGFREYIGKLAECVGKDSLDTVDDVIDALIERLNFFKEMGCRASDLGLDYIPFRKASDEECDAAFKKAMAGEPVTKEEAEAYQTKVLIALGKEYHRLDIAMQIHYNCKRNANERKFKEMGPDTGYDMIGEYCCSDAIADLFSELSLTDECPKAIVYSLSAADFDKLATMIACFQAGDMPGKMQLGSAWWFNDTQSGMEAQMQALANNGLLGNFIGMLTDSRSFLSYPRFDYFRRIMCNMIGNLVEEGKYPNNEASLKKIVQGISYYNAKRYFNL